MYTQEQVDALVKARAGEEVPTAMMMSIRKHDIETADARLQMVSEKLKYRTKLLDEARKKLDACTCDG